MYYARNQKNRHNCIVLFEAMNNLEYIVFDTETTGLHPEKDYIVELSGVKYRMVNRTPVEVERIDLFMKPPFKMDQKIVDIHGITNEFLEDKPTEAMVINEIENFFGPNPVIVGYNTDFDIDMLAALYRRCGRELHYQVSLDVLEMARDLVSHKETDGYKLGTMAEMYGVNNGLTFHHAIDDVVATGRLLCCFYADYKRNPVIPGSTIVYINFMYFWKGFNKAQSGMYLSTNLGKMYYSSVNKCWCSSEVDLSECDINTLERHLLERTGLSSIKEFGKLTEKKFSELKAKRREEGVYI